jgi:hypothetical protein
MTENTISLASRIRRRWTRAALALAVPAAAIAVPVLAAAPAQAAGDCTTDCVAVTVTPGVDRFSLGVATTTSARISGRITTDNGATTVATTVTPGHTTSTSLSVSNLKQGATFRYDVHGTDLAGNTWRETGYFTTLVRDVSVDFGTLQITDDGDVGGAGEIVGAVQLLHENGTRCTMKALAPLSLTSTTSLSSGSPMTVPGSADLLCGQTTSSVHLQGYLADDDTDAWDDCGHRWPWNWGNGSWSSHFGGDDCADWNYSTHGLADPLPALGTGSKAVAFTTTANPNGQYDWDAGPEWVLTGTATFHHRVPATTLPATTGGVAKLPLTATPKRGGFTVGWTPQTVPGISFYKYAVQYRRTGTTTWSTQLVDVPATSASVTGLDPLAGYDVQVLAQDINGNRSLRSASTVTTQALTDPTTISGWVPGGATLAPGSSVAFSATVTGDPRPVLLQTRPQGADTWTTHETLATNAADQVSGSYPVLPGLHEWRLHAPQSGYSEAASSAVRWTEAVSTIEGFLTTKALVPAGTVLKDRFTVTPGAGRSVVVQFRKAGTSRWRTYQRLTASDAGRATARLKAFAGTRTWRVKVAESVEHGTAAVSGSRVVRGR